LRKQNFKWTGKTDIKVHPMRDGRHVPIKTLMKKMHVEQYDSPAPLRAGIVETRTLVLPLKQSAGGPTIPLVKAGDNVKAGQPVSEPAPNALGAIIHAPFAARVAAVAGDRITLAKS
jgi:Na+-translocating ferredoxin:NAD+ oxidoreductase RnfC subunit